MAFLPSGIDLRDLYLPRGGPSRLTMRRLLTLIKRLPSDSPLWAEIHAAEEAAAEATPERLRERQAKYEGG